MLPRQENILKIVINEYISTAQPVPSEVLAKKYNLGVSPATIRSEMAHLEEEGYIFKPHTSAGSVPSAKGYRYYVESLENNWELPPNEQRLIRHLFVEVEKQLTEWIRLAAALSSRLTQNATLVSMPNVSQNRLHRLELIALQDFLALLVLVLKEAKLKEQLLSFDDAASQEDLNRISRKFNHMFGGLTYRQISARGAGLAPAERQVMKTLVNMMQAEDALEIAEPHVEGLRGMLNQPEFSRIEKVAALLDIMESKQLLKAIATNLPQEQGVQVIIGEENREESLKDLSVVVTRYGVPGHAIGTIAVVGPTRMHYGHNIAIVRNLSRVLSDLMGELHGSGDSWVAG
ncbi:MAG: heat-inducible transcription repressor HrcA [Chloroflexi bacterium]|nr:heat-inducible transcription repressor HrcA [Chloroflexota bacterium]